MVAAINDGGVGVVAVDFVDVDVVVFGCIMLWLALLSLMLFLLTRRSGS